MSNFNLSYILKVVDKFTPALTSFKNKIGAVEAATQKFSGNLQALSSSIKSGALFVGLTLPLVAVAGWAWHSAENFERMGIELQAMLAPGESAEDLLEQIVNISKEIPLAPEALKDATQNLLGYGVSLENIPTKLKQIATAAYATGKSTEEITSLFGRAFTGAGTMSRLAITRGRVIGLIPELRKLAKEMNVSDESFNKWLAKPTGLIPAKVMLQALTNVTKEGGAMFEAANAKANTMQGTLDRMKNTAARLAASLGNVIFNDSVSANFKGLADSFDRIETKFTAFSEAHAGVMKFVVGLGAAAASIGVLAIILKAVAFIVGAMFSPFFLIPALIGGIIAGAVYLYQTFVPFQKLVDNVWQLMQSIWSGIVEKFKPALEIILELFKGIAGIVGKIFGWVFEGIGNIADKLARKIDVTVAAQGNVLMAPAEQQANMGNIVAPQYALERPHIQGFQSDLNINIRDPGKYIESTRAVTNTGRVNFDLGYNMAGAR